MAQHEPLTRDQIAATLKDWLNAAHYLGTQGDKDQRFADLLTDVDTMMRDWWHGDDIDDPEA